jgi:hypothetical protein
VSGSTVLILVLSGIIAFALVLFLIFARLMRQSARESLEAERRQRQHLQRLNQAGYAEASILSVRNSAAVGVSDVKVDISLQVKPPDGASYQAITTWLVELAALSQLQPGQTLQVKIDRNDSRLIYPVSEWAKFWLSDMA